MTLGQFAIFRGKISYGNVRPDPDESFGVIFSVVALLGEPKCAVQVSITWPFLTSGGETAGSASEWLRPWIAGTMVTVPCEFCFDWRCPESRLNPGWGLYGVVRFNVLAHQGQTRSCGHKRLAGKVTTLYGLHDDVLWIPIWPPGYIRNLLCKCIFDLTRKWP